MSTINMSQTPSAACCNTPVAIVKGYQEKGTYIDVAGMKTYTTGPETATRAILIVYDIFGFFPQTIQGADILAYHDKGHEHQVFMPDFFDGKPADISWYPPDTKEKGEKLGQFFKTTAAPPQTLERIPKVVQEIQSRHPTIESWGILGFCWGGKIVNLSSASGTPFKAAAAAHPAMIDAGDAAKLTIPILLLPSKDESKDDVAKWEQAVTVKHEVHWYDDQVHGFMAARGDLGDANVKEKYQDAYHRLLVWFHQNL